MVLDVLEKHNSWQNVFGVIQKLEASGFTAYLAGGCVRDMILKKMPQDLDVATSAPPDRVEELFANTIGIGKEFGTIIVVFEGGGQCEVTTFRQDKEYRDGRHPEGVVFSDAAEDAKRRDFTINALFFSPTQGKIYDFVDGQLDLKKRVIRAVGEPTLRFTEDHLRVLRALRFHAQLGFEIEPKTLKAIKKLAPQLKRIAKERIWQEWKKLFLGDHFFSAVKLALDTKVINSFYPRTISLELLKKTPPELHVRIFAFLLAQVSHPKRLTNQVIEKQASYLKWDRELKEKLKSWARALEACVHSKKSGVEVWQNFEVLSKHGLHNISMVYLQKKGLAKERARFARLSKEFTKKFRGSLPPPLVGGKDLLNLGHTPNKKFGDILNQVYNYQLETNVHSKEELLEWVKRLRS